VSGRAAGARRGSAARWSAPGSVRGRARRVLRLRECGQSWLPVPGLTSLVEQRPRLAASPAQDHHEGRGHRRAEADGQMACVGLQRRCPRGTLRQVATWRSSYARRHPAVRSSGSVIVRGRHGLKRHDRLRCNLPNLVPWVVEQLPSGEQEATHMGHEKVREFSEVVQH